LWKWALARCRKNENGENLRLERVCGKEKGKPKGQKKVVESWTGGVNGA
jgi:hypothetical protein